MGSRDGGDDSAGIAAGIDVMTLNHDPEPAVTSGDGRQVEPAPPAARAAARVIDSVIHAALGVGGLLLIFLATFCIWCATHQTNSGQAALGALALIGWVLYEPVMVAWRGQTLGQQATSIAVVCYPHSGEQGLSRRRSRIRWAVPYGAFMAAGAAGTASVAALGVWGLVVGAAAAGWTAVSASVLLDDDRRGWHDGDDAVYGGAGDDTLDGGNGTDHLDGGPGGDSCTRASTTSGCEMPVGVR